MDHTLLHSSLVTCATTHMHTHTCTRTMTLHWPPVLLIRVCIGTLTNNLVLSLSPFLRCLGLVPNLMGQVPEKAMRLFIVDRCVQTQTSMTISRRVCLLVTGCAKTRSNSFHQKPTVITTAKLRSAAAAVASQVFKLGSPRKSLLALQRALARSVTNTAQHNTTQHKTQHNDRR